MTARHFVYGTMVNDPDIANEVGGPDLPRIFAKKSMTSNVEQHPFIVYKLGNETPEIMNEQLEVTRQFFQVWVHDFDDSQTADYDRIDRIILKLRTAFFNQGSGPENIWTTNWVETSQDFNDDTLKTIFKYVRFQLVRRAQ